MVSKVLDLGLRGFEFLWTLLIMASIGNMIADANAGNPSIVNYTMFVAVFSMLCLFYLIPVSFNEGLTGHPIIPLVLDVLNTIFFFCGAVALAADLHVHSCNNRGYILSNGVTNGSDNPSKRCHEAQASTAFLWFGFACWLATTVLSALSSKGGANMRMGGIRKGGPSMSQV